MSRPAPQARRTLARQGPPPGIYASKFEPGLAAAICRRIAAGESIAAICADPAMPTGKTLWNWARAHEGFAQMKAHALAVARSRRKPPPSASPTPPAEGEERRVAWNEGMDGYFLDYSVAWRVIGALEQGASLREVCREPWAPCVGTFYNWLKRHPELRGAYAQAKEIAGWVAVETAREDAPWLGTEAASEKNLQRSVRAAQTWASRIASRRYGAHAGPAGLRVVVAGADGTRRVVYEGTVAAPSAHPGAGGDPGVSRN